MSWFEGLFLFWVEFLVSEKLKFCAIWKKVIEFVLLPKFLLLKPQY